MLTKGGFSLHKGAGTLAGRIVGGSLSNKRIMNQFISAWVRTIQNKEYQIRMTNHQQLKIKLKNLPAAGLRLGSANRGYSYASFSRRPRGQIC
jgi:hypothetical protein